MTFRPWPTADPAHPRAVRVREPRGSSEPRTPHRGRRLARALLSPGLTGLVIALLPILERITPAGASWRATLLLTFVLAGALIAAQLWRPERPGSAREAAQAERERVVRDLHDGAQQRLLHTVIALKLARRTLRSGGNTEPLMEEALTHAEQAIRELRDLAHGILPQAVTHRGLRAGVEALTSRVPLAVNLDIGTSRLSLPVEANAYFVIAEALTNAVKHAGADSVCVRAHVAGESLRVEIRDDGAGGAELDGGPGLRGMRDRVESLGGRLRIESPCGGGTLVAARIPLHPVAACSGTGRLASSKVRPREWRGRFAARKDAM